MARDVSMETFINDLEALASQGFKTEDVHLYLQETLIEPTALDRYVTHRDDRYTRNLVHKSASFEVLVICWKGNQEAPIHGHEGERCWARVERGALRFSNYRELSEEPLIVERVGDPVDGEPGYLDGPADIHKVENRTEAGGAAASLHVYSNPYGECDIYDLVKGEKRRVRMEYDTVFGNPPEAAS